MSGARREQFAAALLVVGAAITMWVLAAQNRELKAEVTRLRLASTTNSIQVGRAIPDLRATTLDGTAVSLDELGEKAAVVAFATTTVRDWVARWDIDFEVWVTNQPALRQPVPTTTVVRRRVVQRIWVGTLRDLDISGDVLQVLALE